MSQRPCLAHPVCPQGRGSRARWTGRGRRPKHLEVTGSCSHGAGPEEAAPREGRQPGPGAPTKCWSLRRCTTRDVQSPMGTRSGDVLYKRSRHRAALCFTLSMASLQGRQQSLLRPAGGPAQSPRTTPRVTTGAEAHPCGGCRDTQGKAASSSPRNKLRPTSRAGSWWGPRLHSDRQPSARGAASTDVAPHTVDGKGSCHR